MALGFRVSGVCGGLTTFVMVDYGLVASGHITVTQNNAQNTTFTLIAPSIPETFGIQ